VVAEPVAVFNGVDVAYAKHKRPPLQWVGGKHKMRHWIIQLLPVNARVYVEPFAGSAAVLLALPRPYPIEVLNDLDSHLVNFYRVLQNRQQFRQLMQRLVWTPYAREEVGRAAVTLRNGTAEPVDRAWALFVAHNQALSGHRATGPGRWAYSKTQLNKPSRFTNRVAELRSVRNRLLGVNIEHLDAIECIQRWDCEDTVFYVDPPYHPETHGAHDAYAIGPDAEHTRRLVDALLAIRGQAVVSGYDHPEYQRLERAGWERHEKLVLSMTQNAALISNRERTEVAWVKRHPGAATPRLV
jgi:DNA adenine methylase